MHYNLLPFRFTRVGHQEILVNEAGDWIAAPAGSVQRIVHREVQREEELYKDLASRFFISEEPLPPLLDVLAARVRANKAFLDRFTSLHIFVPTLRCNSHCNYCQASSCGLSQQGFDITPRRLDRAVDLMFGSPSPSLTMEFQGGEPTLVAPLVERAIERALEINCDEKRSLSFVICSNCIDFPDELLAFCRLHGVTVSTSLDGPEALHDSGRGAGSYSRTLAGIHRVRETLGEDSVSPLATITEAALDAGPAIVDAYRAAGFHRIFLRPLNPYGLAGGRREWNLYNRRFVEFYKETLSYILSLNRAGECFAEDFATLFLKRMLTPFSTGYVDMQSPAGIINSVALYNYDGKVYASDEARMLGRQGDDRFCLGTVDDDYQTLFYGPRTEQLARLWCTEYIAGCSDCPWQTYCGADPVRNYTLQGDPYGHRPTSLLCARNDAIIRHLFSLLLHGEGELMPIFRNWLTQ